MTSTPVIDPAMNTLYVVAITKASSDSAYANPDAYFYYLYSIDLSTGKDKYPRVEIKVRGSAVRPSSEQPVHGHISNIINLNFNGTPRYWTV